MDLWVAKLAFLGAVIGAAISYFAVRRADQGSFARLLEEKNQDWLKLHTTWERERWTRFDEDRLSAYSELAGTADMATFYAMFPQLSNRVELLESALNQLRVTVGRVQLLAKTHETRQRAYNLLTACNSLHEPVVETEAALPTSEVDERTGEAFSRFFSAARDELQIKDGTI